MKNIKFDEMILKYGITVKIEHGQKYLVVDKMPALRIDKNYLYTHRAALIAYIREKTL